MKGEERMNKGKVSIIVGLQVAFLVGILAFNGGLTYRNIGMPVATTTLKAQLGLQVDTDATAYEKFRDKREVAAKVATIVRDLQQGKIPEGTRSLGKVDEQDAFGVNLEGTDLIILPNSQITELKDVATAVELANAQVGILQGGFPKTSSAGIREVALPPFLAEKPAVILGSVEAMKLTTLQSRAEAVVVAPPTPAMLEQAAAMVSRHLPEELAEAIIIPAEAETWKEAFEELGFRAPVVSGAAEVTRLAAEKRILGTYARQFEAPGAIVAEESRAAKGLVSTYAYEFYLTQQDRVAAQGRGLRYRLKVMIPGKVGSEYIMAQGMYLTNPIVIRPVTAPIEVSIQTHKTEAGEPYLFPRLERLAEQVRKELLTSPVSKNVSIFVKPGQPLLIPQGVGVIVRNLTNQPVLMEELTYAQETPVPMLGLLGELKGGAHRVMATAEGGITITPNPEYQAQYGELPEPTLAFPAELYETIGLREGKSLYSLMSVESPEVRRLAAFLEKGQLTLEEAGVAANIPAEFQQRILTQRGELPIIKGVPEAVAAKAIGLPVSIKAASAGMAPAGMYQFAIEPTQIKQIGEKEETLGTLDWSLDQLKQAEGIAGVTLAEAPKTIEEAKAQIEKLLAEVKRPTVEFGKITTAAEEEQLVQPAAEGLERVIVPISEKEAIVMVEPAGAFKPVMAKQAIAPILEKADVERGAILIDFNCLGIKGTRKDGSDVFIPNDFVMKAIPILNNLNAQTLKDGKTPRYHVAVYSDSVSAEETKNLLGALAVPFNSFVQASTVAEAVGQIAAEQKIKQERFVVTIANRTVKDNPKVLDGFAKLAEAVNLVMVKTPEAGEYVSYKSILLNSLKLLEGVLTPQQITDLKVDIESAPTIRGLTVEPEKDTDKAVSRMQAAVSV